MQLAWLTDIHLNFLEKDVRREFYRQIMATCCEAVLITGDIAEAPSLTAILNEMADHIKLPIYFVLGNHDYYRGKVDEVRERMSALTKENRQLFWLPASGLQWLDENIILLGQDGWADGRLGDYQNSRVSLNDSRMIADLFQAKVLGKSQLLEKMQQLADVDAIQLKENLLEAVNQHPKKIVVLTHVPPFKESCMHEGKISDDNWLPFFSSKTMGDILMPIAKENPSIKFLVLCGHTHSESFYEPLENLIIEAGQSEYYRPHIQKIIGW